MKRLLFIYALLLPLIGCTSQKHTANQIKKAMKEDPSILVEAMKAHPVQFMEALQEVAISARGSMEKKRKAKESKEFEDSFQKPLAPVIRKDESIRGTKGAPLVLVEYSDFECGYCQRAFGTVQALLKKYKGKIQFIYKHLPLSFHKNALLASKYYEAIRLQDEKKAFKFHDDVYANQRKIKKGEKFFKSLAKKLNLDMPRLKKDVASQKVASRIKEDQKEAAKFNFSGTPAFIFNGVPVKGALPTSHFEMIIEKLKKKGKITL